MRSITQSYYLTGREIERALVAAVNSNLKITLLENHMVVELLTSGEDNDKMYWSIYFI